MNVAFNPMISNNKAQNISCKGKEDRIKEVRDTEKYLAKFNKSQKAKKQHSIDTSKYQNTCYKCNFKDKSKNLMQKINAFFGQQIIEHPTRTSLLTIAGCIAIAICIYPPVEKLLDKVYNKSEVKQWAPQEAERISQISDKKERTIAYQDAADSIKNAHTFENTMKAIKEVIIADPNMACDIINSSKSDETRDEAFRKVATQIKTLNKK